jgi:integrase/recombinase XerD
MAGLKAKEIALLTWEMITDADRQVGQAIHLQDKASEGRSGRIINLNGELRSAPGFKGSPGVQGRQIHMVSSERSAKVSPQTVVNIFSSWHELFGFDECSSHS